MSMYSRLLFAYYARGFIAHAVMVMAIIRPFWDTWYEEPDKMYIKVAFYIKNQLFNNEISYIIAHNLFLISCENKMGPSF